MVKRLTIIPTDAAVRGRISGERRMHQRRLSIGRRLGESRRASAPSGQPLSQEQNQPAQQRQRAERRGIAPRRRLADRRSGARVFDLRNLDLSELDSLDS